MWPNARKTSRSSGQRKRAGARRRSSPAPSLPPRRSSSRRPLRLRRLDSDWLERAGSEPARSVRLRVMQSTPGRDYAFRITGGSQLAGDLCVSGSKNAALPEMAAALLTSEPLRLTNVPRVSDTEVMAQILTDLGGRSEGDGSLVLRMGKARGTNVPDELGRRMRATIVLLGALLGRFGQARLPRPGGDDIGARRVEQHMRGLRQMGARIEETATEIVAEGRRPRRAPAATR